MRDVMDQHPDHVFVVISPPPLNPAATTPEAAARARAFADWLTSDAYLEGHPNVFAFDFFDHLAEDDPTASDYNMLRAAYRDGEDSHPNQTANEVVGPAFSKAVMSAARSYRERQGLTTPMNIGSIFTFLLENEVNKYENWGYKQDWGKSKDLFPHCGLVDGAGLTRRVWLHRLACLLVLCRAALGLLRPTVAICFPSDAILHSTRPSNQVFFVQGCGVS
jgi:hypothetical protein